MHDHEMEQVLQQEQAKQQAQQAGSGVDAGLGDLAELGHDAVRGVSRGINHLSGENLETSIESAVEASEAPLGEAAEAGSAVAEGFSLLDLFDFDLDIF